MRQTVAIVGAGRVGRELGRRLRLLGWRIGAVVTRTPASARTAVKWIGAGKAQAGISREVLAADLILVAVPDRVICDVASELARVGAGLTRPSSSVRGRKKGGAKPPLHCVVLHTSGSLSHEVLAPLSRLGAAIGAMHPMQTFGRAGRPDFRGTVFGLDGDGRAVRLGRQIAKALGGTPVVIDARKKAAYHCAGGFAAAHVLAVMEAGIRLLTDVGLTRQQAARSLGKMARQTLDNLEQHGARAAWSGPVARGDFATVAKHIEVLRGYPGEFRAAYESLTRLVIQLVAEKPAQLLRQLNAATRRASKESKR